MLRVLGAAMMAAAIAPWVGATGAANAADSVQKTVDIGAGETAIKVGTATFTLDATTLTIDTTLDTEVSLGESSACVDDQAFTSRIPPGQCQFKNSSGDYAISLATVQPPLTGSTVCVQVHYTVEDGREGGSGGQTAFAGHQNDRRGFYGNVCLTPVPTTTTTSAPATTTTSAPATTTTSAPVTTTAPATTTVPVAATTTAVETTAETSVLPTKVGATTDDSQTPEATVSVRGVKTGGGGDVLADTGFGGLPLGAALAVSLGLLLGGAALLFVPGRVTVERSRDSGRHRRRH